MMAKDIGYTFAIITRNPKNIFVFCKWFTSQQDAIDYAVGELKDRSYYDVDFIIIREGTNDSKDPIIWDSRKNYVPVPVVPAKSPIQLKIEELHSQNKFDKDTLDKLLGICGETQ